jgi:hypothetical protein
MQLVDPVEAVLNTHSMDIWDRVLTVFTDLLEKTEADYVTKATCKFVLLI